MAPLFIQSFAVTGAWQKLAATKTVLTVAITAFPTNAQPVNFRINGGTSVPWPSGTSNTLFEADLNTIEVSGAVGDSILVTAGIAQRTVGASLTAPDPGGGPGID